MVARGRPLEGGLARVRDLGAKITPLGLTRLKVGFTICMHVDRMEITLSCADSF